MGHIDKERCVTGRERHESGAQEKAWPEIERVSSADSDSSILESR